MILNFDHVILLISSNNKEDLQVQIIVKYNNWAKRKVVEGERDPSVTTLRKIEEKRY